MADGDLQLGPGDLATIHKGVEHQPIAPVETEIVLFEPAGVVNTGD